MMISVSVNEYGLDVFEEMMDNADELQVDIQELDNGTTVSYTHLTLPTTERV